MVYKKRDKPAGAPRENTNGIALKEEDVRQDAYEDYCAYLATGRSKRGWTYTKNGLSCTYETMEKYMKDNIEFDPAKKKAAEAQGYKKWEGVVMDSADGTNKNANTASLQMLMRNKFGWDKPEPIDERQESLAAISLNAFVLQLRNYQNSAEPQPLMPIDLDNRNE